ncbi:DUF885 domain-containing protein [Flaviflexus equikiangi]|uniref:DUF885 domain-containing protein n=1 Tax=Flaviflexus equikiangi TaxID=2758573 RepID=A0ABS2TGM3_9ACTO|nr:DUF885 domain-containing protein [Flaviflexus equikiangi]MBM9432686.1 DUF885 domain-containing protein [Flaviflexus equikiangi]
MSERTRIDEIADSYVTSLCKISPLFASATGMAKTGLLDDFSPEGIQERIDLDQATLRELRNSEPTSDNDWVTKAAMIERLESSLAIAPDEIGALNVIASPIQDIRDSFDLMDRETDEDWDLIRERLEAIPTALRQYREALSWRHDKGAPFPARQIAAGVQQAQQIATGGILDELTERGMDTDEARASFADLAAFLSSLPQTSVDGIGRDRYPAHLKYFLGSDVDVDETFEWAEHELASIISEQEKTAAVLYGPGTTIAETIERLNSDPARQIHGRENLREWMQKTADDAVAGTLSEFDIPESLRRIDAKVLYPGTGGIYYTQPSDDLSRPGAMWWSVPEGVETFNTWLEKTTVYHEGVPGHHLQIGTTVASPHLNSWRRLASWVSGHGEGWALYAERLMADLGFLDDPGDYFGMLDSQRLRAARVRVDIGVHVKGWTAEQAWDFLTANVAMDHSFLAFELDRYLGWPGQAPSYKIGQRLWESERDAALARGESLKDFHTRALSLGTVGLDVLHEALSR